MKPVKFEGSNTIIGKNQKQYNPLPAKLEDNGDVTICWKLSWKDRFFLLFTGKIWSKHKTFNKNFQPVKINRIEFDR